jgi:hypothetical protein
MIPHQRLKGSKETVQLSQTPGIDRSTDEQTWGQEVHRR